MSDSLDEMLAGMVSPLEWEEFERGSGLFAHSIFGRYSAWEYDVSGYWKGPEDYDARLAGNAGGGVEAAKAAAQQDYARRIISALNPDILRGMREALQPFADAVFNDNGDVTLDTSHITTRDYLRAQKVARSLSPKDPSDGK